MKTKLIFLLALLLVISSTPICLAMGNTTDLQTQERIVTTLLEQSVPSEKIEGLLFKLNNNILWDSLDESKLPVSEEVSITDTIYEKISRFEDGSYIERRVDLTDAKRIYVGTGVEPGENYGGTGYHAFIGAKVYTNYAIIQASFKADFSLVYGGYDRISRVYSPKVFTQGGTFSDMSLSIVNSTEGYYPANARLSFIASAWAGFLGGYITLDLNVGGDTYWATTNILDYIIP